MRRLASALALVAALLAPATLRAEQRLHVPVDDIALGEGPLLDQPAEGRNPAALRVGRREIPEPDHTERLGEGELPMSSGAPSPATLGRADRFRPDLATDEFPEHLHYTSTFEPSVAPFKRVSSLDGVGRGYELTIASRTLVEVPVGGRPEAGRELFWGSVAVSFRPGEPAPIPSVAPGARILSVRSTPGAVVRFYRDGADNYYATSDLEGLVRLVFVMDAPSSYFGGPLPPTATAEAVPTALRPVLPGPERAAALRVARTLGLDPAAPIARNLPRLVTYLRSFVPSPLEVGPGQDPYVTLALGRRGVCRHRAFVFVVTAQALGLPARLVTNEAHAFAEVWLPGTGWRRIDLGGAGPLADPTAEGLRHEPAEADPIPWPPGERSSSTPHRPDGPRAPASGAGAPSDAPGESGPGRLQPLAVRPAEGPPRVVPGEGPPVEGGPDAGPAPAPVEAVPRPAPARVVVEDHSPQVLRGEAVLVSGRVEGAAGAGARARVSIGLRRADGAEAVALGTVVADGAGAFRARLAVPADLPAGDYSITATLEGP